ncbi:MAG: AMP-binding protein, partial [Clostridia bacterium]|nr:AMP-binding protein [Clostridia bacterium]
MNERTTPTVRELIDRAANIYEDKTFLKFVRDGKVEERSYRTTQQNALAVCRWIRSLSTERMHVALISNTSYEYITCLTGILISGNVAIPFSPDISAGEATKLLERADVDLLLFENEFAQKAVQIKEDCPGLKYAVNIGDESYFNQIYKTYDAESEFAPLSDYAVDPAACACMIFTSGTTGVRKGVMLSTEALVGNIMYHDYSTDIFNETDTALSVLPMYHIYCFTGDYLKNLKDGLQVALNGSLRNIVQNLTLFEPRVMRVVPMIAQTLLRRVKAVLARNPDMEPRDAARKVFGRNMKWLISGGAYLDPALIDEYDKFGIYLRQGYGMTEAGCRISVPDETAAKDS